MRLVASLSLLLGSVLAGCQSMAGGDDLEKGVPYQLSAKATSPRWKRVCASGSPTRAC